MSTTIQGDPAEFAVHPFMRTPPIGLAGDDEPRRRKVIPFPAPPADRCLAMAMVIEEASAILGDDLTAIIDVAQQLLAVDDLTFASRLADLRRDEDGRALLSEVLAGVQAGLVGLDRIGRALFVVRARLTAGIATGGAHGR